MRCRVRQDDVLRAATLWIEVMPHLDAKYGGIATSAPRASSKRRRLAHRSAIAAVLRADEMVSPDAVGVDVFPLGRMKLADERGLRRRFARAWSKPDGFTFKRHLARSRHARRGAGTPPAQAVHRPRRTACWTPGRCDTRSSRKQIYAALIERRQLARAACLLALTVTEYSDFRRFGLRNP